MCMKLRIMPKMQKCLTYLQLPGNMSELDCKSKVVISKECKEKKIPISPCFGDRFSKMSRLGCGTFGEVWKGYDGVLARWVAIKTFQEVASDHLGINMMVIREISLLRKLNHPNIIKALDVLIGKRINSEGLLLVMELEDMDLYTYQRKFEKSMTLSTVQFIIRQILEACLYLHSNHVMHRDLKPDNILICSATRVIKIADLGYSRTFTHVITAASISVKYSWPVQAPSYKAPEVLLGCDSYSSAVDVWSIGCILGELLCGGRKLFNVPSVKVKTESGGGGGLQKRKRSSKTEEGNEEDQDDDDDASCEKISSASASRVKKETIISSLHVIFELLGPVCDSHAPSLRLLPNYTLITTGQSAIMTGQGSASTLVETLLERMESRLRCVHAARLVLWLLTLDPSKRPDCASVLLKSEFLSASVL